MRALRPLEGRMEAARSRNVAAFSALTASSGTSDIDLSALARKHRA